MHGGLGKAAHSSEESSSTTGNAAQATSAASAHTSVQGRPAAQRPVKSSKGTTTNTADPASSLSSRAAAAELGTESDSLTAQKSSKVARPASTQHLPGLADEEGGLELVDYEDSPPSGTSVSRSAVDKAHSTTAGSSTGTSSSALPSGRATAQAGQTARPVSASTTGSNSSTDAVVAAALANPKSSASRAAVLAAAQKAAAEEDEQTDEEEELGASLQAGQGTATRPKGSAVSGASIHKGQTQTQALQEDEEALGVQLRPSVGRGTAGKGGISQNAVGQQSTSDMTPAEVAELNREYDEYVDPTPSRAQAQQQAGSKGGSAHGTSALGTYSNSGAVNALPASQRYTQSNELLGDDDEPRAATGGKLASGDSTLLCLVVIAPVYQATPWLPAPNVLLRLRPYPVRGVQLLGVDPLVTLACCSLPLGKVNSCCHGSCQCTSPRQQS